MQQHRHRAEALSHKGKQARHTVIARLASAVGAIGLGKGCGVDDAKLVQWLERALEKLKPGDPLVAQTPQG